MAPIQADPPPPRALLFDWDNTLVDSWLVIHAALAHTFEALGQRPWSLEETKERVRQSAREAFPKLFGARAQEASETFYHAFETMHLERLQPLPGAQQLLQELEAGGFYLAVVSNKRGDLLRREAAHLGWDRHFTALVGANDAARDKPARDAVDLALAGSGRSPGPDVWFVGDTDIDLRCAHAHGCTAVLLRPQTPGPDEFADCRPHLHLPDCPALGHHMAGRQA